MNIIKGNNINELVFKSIDAIFSEGHHMNSRNGDVCCVYNTDLVLENPKERYLCLNGRKNNIFATIAESLWVLAGMSKISPYLSFFLPRAPLYSDNGKTWRAAYGERLYAYGQLNNIIEVFKNDGIFSRRAVISLYFPNLDTCESLKREYGIEKSLDVPCNNLLIFYVTPDYKLNMKVTQRSGDIIFGVGSINIFEFTLIQELVLNVINKELWVNLTLGQYYHSVINLHIYMDKKTQGIDILNNNCLPNLWLNNGDPCISFLNTFDENKRFFTDVVEYLTFKILSDEAKNNIDKEIISIFCKYKLNYNNNIIFDYIQSVACFIMQKKFNVKGTVHTSSRSLKKSIVNSTFNRIINVTW